MSSPKSPDDEIDIVMAQWQQERPDLDFSALGVLGRVAKLSAVLGGVVNAVFARHGLTETDFDVLSTLRRTGPPYTLIPSQLSATLMMSRTGMTSRLDSLERRGFVTRSLDPADRRSFRVTLTDQGFALIDRVLDEHAANLAEIVAPLTARQILVLESELKRLLRAVSSA